MLAGSPPAMPGCFVSNPRGVAAPARSSGHPHVASLHTLALHDAGLEPPDPLVLSLLQSPLLLV